MQNNNNVTFTECIEYNEIADYYFKIVITPITLLFLFCGMMNLVFACYYECLEKSREEMLEYNQEFRDYQISRDLSHQDIQQERVIELNDIEHQQDILEIAGETEN